MVDSHKPEPPVISTVFVVHGRSRVASEGIFNLLRAFGLLPLEWAEIMHRTGIPNPYIGDVLDVAFSDAQAVVVLFTPDDLASLDPDLITSEDEDYERTPMGQARPNVLFEAGMAMGRDPGRTVLVEIGKLRRFSDVAGRHILRYDGSVARRLDLARRLEAAGCPINLRGDHWQTVGPDLAAPILDAPDGGRTSDHLKVSASLRPSSLPERQYLILENLGPASLSIIKVEFPQGDALSLAPEAKLPHLAPGTPLAVPIVILDPSNARPVEVTLTAEGYSKEPASWTFEVSGAP